jgi:hypothetical protein
MSMSYAGILEQYQLNSILTNIVRAAGERPLSFLDIPNINGSGNVNTSASLSGSLNGLVGGLPGGPAGVTSISPSLSLSFGNSFNFSQSSLDNATFLRGFLSPIPVETAKFFISDNLPREVMFSLLISSIELKHPDGRVDKFVNNPLLQSYPAFQKELYELLGYGLTVEQIEVKPAGFSPGMGSAYQAGQYSSATPSPYAGMVGYPNAYGGGMYGVGPFGPMPTQYKYKICMDQNKFSNFVKQKFSSDAFCKVPQSAVKENSSKTEIVINMRSTNNVFEYLGQVVAAQNQVNPYLVVLPPAELTNNRKVGQSNPYALLVVNKNSPQAKNFAYVKDIEGNIYSIPSENNGYSPMVIKIISSLLSLNKIPGSIPSSPGILVR